MHLIVPFAAPLSEGGHHALHALQLPALDALLARLTLAHRDDGDASSFSPPHERALARALGFAGADGELPFAAWHAQQDGIGTDDLAWGELTPVHWEVGADGVRLLDPAALALDDAGSHAIFELLQPLFEAEGALLLYGAPTRWYLAHESLRALRCASLDRVIGRNIEAWLPSGPQARLMRRLQNEAQMLLHEHGVNEWREAHGLWPINSFWLSGCGLPQGVRTHEPPRVEERLRVPALAEDWAAWVEAWTRLASELPRMGLTTLTLCGERSAVQYATRERSWWQRLRGTLQAPSALSVLESL
jgi:hypothetical protein